MLMPSIRLKSSLALPVFFGLGFKPSLSKWETTDGAFHPPDPSPPVDCADFTDLTSTLTPPLSGKRGPSESLHDLLLYSFDHLGGGAVMTA